MAGLIRFDELKPAADANAAQSSIDQTEDFPSAQIIDQLRHRLISPEYHDSIDVKVMIAGELVYFCYRELWKRRIL